MLAPLDATCWRLPSMTASRNVDSLVVAVEPKRIKERENTSVNLSARCKSCAPYTRYAWRVNMASTDARCLKSKQGGIHCSAPNCSNSMYNVFCKGKSFFRFPLDEARCALWVQNTRREDIRRKSTKQLHDLRLCSDHFEPSQFTTPERKRLVWNGVPTVFAVPNPPPQLAGKRPPPRERDTLAATKKPRKDAVDVTVPPAELDSVQDVTELDSKTTPRTTITETSPRKKLKAQAKKWRNAAYYNMRRTRAKSLVSRSQIITELSRYLNGQALQFVKTQIMLCSRKKEGMRWNAKDKSLALSLYHASPKAYQLLRRIFALPTIKTLRIVMKKIEIYPGISDTIISTLKTKLSSMPVESQHCSLAFDEIALKERVVYNSSRDEVEGFEDFGSRQKTAFVANHATAFVLRGLQSKWKQAIGYVLSSGPINSDTLHGLLLNTLSKLHTAGISVKIIISDQGSNNRRVFHTLCQATVEKPFFEHQGNRYFIMYDPPHLLKNVRNNLKKSGYTMGNNKISWVYIEEFFKFDSQNPIRLAPKVSSRHIDLPPFANLNVKLAAQVLSHTVAAGISTLVQLGALPKEAIHTAQFLEKIDKLFNAFNSGSKKATQQMRHAFTEVSGHCEFLLETRAWLQSLTSLSKRHLPCLSGWVLNINSLLALWEDLHGNHGIKLLFTNRLNQDHVENLFSVIRGKNGHNYHPDAQQFRTAFRAAMVDSLISHSAGSNCMDDMDAFLLNLESLTAETPTVEPAAEETQGADNPKLAAQEENGEMTEDIEQLCKMAVPCPFPSSPLMQNVQDNIINYIGGYIARKVRLHVCSDCADRLTGDWNPTATKEIFTSNKQFCGVKEGLLTPSRELFETVKQLEATYMLNAQPLLHNFQVKQTLLTLFKQRIQSALSCSSQKCDLTDRVFRLFLSIRLHFTLKDSSRSFSTCSGKRNRKMVVLSHE